MGRCRARRPVATTRPDQSIVAPSARVTVLAVRSAEVTLVFNRHRTFCAARGSRKVSVAGSNGLPSAFLDSGGRL